MEKAKLIEQLKSILAELESEPTKFWPSSIPGQQIERVTNNPSIDFTVAMLGGKPVPTPERDANLSEAARQITETVYQGRFPATNFLHGPNDGKEAAFIFAANYVYWEKHGDTEFIYRRAGLFSGTHWDIARLIGYGEQEQIFEHKSYKQTIEDFPDTPLKRAVMEFLE